jgi:hypothetical protein
VKDIEDKTKKSFSKVGHKTQSSLNMLSTAFKEGYHGVETSAGGYGD